MAAISLFWYTDAVAMTSYASDLFRKSWPCFYGNSRSLNSFRLRVVSNFSERQKGGQNTHARLGRHATREEIRVSRVLASARVFARSLASHRNQRPLTVQCSSTNACDVSLARLQRLLESMQTNKITTGGMCVHNRLRESIIRQNKTLRGINGIKRIVSKMTLTISILFKQLSTKSSAF